MSCFDPLASFTYFYYVAPERSFTKSSILNIVYLTDSESIKSGVIFLKKVGQPRPLLSFIFGLLKQTSLQFLKQINVENVHPVHGTGI